MQLFEVHGVEDRKYWESLAANPLLARIGQGLVPVDDVGARPNLPSATEYLAAKRHNNRHVIDLHWRTERAALSRLALNRLMGGVATDDRLLCWIFDLLYEPTWVVSAHLPGHDLPKSGDGQLDLAGCEMAAALAEMREALLPWMRHESGTLDVSIVNEIDRRCLKPFVDQPAPWWADPEHHLNNWTGVCAGALLTACLSLEAQGFARHDAKRKSIDAINMFFERAFTETGECDEGPSYWQYGVEKAITPLTRMERSEIERAFDVKRIRQVASYLERAHITNGRFYAANDCTPNPKALIGPMAWLAEFADSDFLRWWVGIHHQPISRNFNAMLRDMEAMEQLAEWAKLPAPGTVPARLLPDQQAGIFQRETAKGLFTLTVGGGHNGESHNHNDLGTMQVLLDDTAWVLDPGNAHYTTDFFGPQRYTKYIVAASGGHCCPAINGQEQFAGRAAEGKIVDAGVKAGRLALDLTRAYPEAARLKKWVRSVEVNETAAAVVRDEIELNGSGEVTHRIWLREKPVVEGAVLCCGPVRVELSPAPQRMVVEPFSAGDERLNLREYEPEKLLYRVSATYPVAKDEASRVTWRISV